MRSLVKTILIVVREFADYKRGTRIEDPAVIQKLQASHHTSRFVLTQVSDDSRFSTPVH
jgi:hypothetical protein